MSRSRNLWDSLYQVARIDFKLRDQGTFLGFLWTLLNPALMFLILYQIFSHWTKKYIPDFGWHLLIGLIQWNFFATSTTHALVILEKKRYLIRNFSFDKAILPLASVLSIFASFVFENAAMIGLLGFFHGISLWVLPLYVLMMAILLGFALATALLLSSLHVFYRDIENIWSLMLRIGFFVTPVFYPPQIISERKFFFVKLNPLYHILTGSRDILLRGSVPSLNGLLYLLVSLGCLIIVSWFVFRKTEPLIAENL